MNIKELIQKELDAISNLPIDESFEHAIDLIYYYVHRLNGKVVTAGIGKAGHIAHNIAMTFASTGTRSVFIHPTEAQHGDLGILAENDILLVISNSGKTREVIEFINISRNLYPEMRTILITGNKESDLAKLADCTLWTGGAKELDRFELVPTTSTTLMTIIGDIIVVGLMEKIDFTKEHYQLLHHSGYLSVKLKEQLKNEQHGTL